ncbi:MAG: hypothetical protein ACR2MN_06525 [Acidimicrobiales bacterium]
MTVCTARTPADSVKVSDHAPPAAGDANVAVSSTPSTNGFSTTFRPPDSAAGNDTFDPSRIAGTGADPAGPKDKAPAPAPTVTNWAEASPAIRAAPGGADLGCKAPPGPGTNVRSNGCQAPPWSCQRTGVGERVSVTVPSGFATTIDFAVVNAGTATTVLDRCASAFATCNGDAAGAAAADNGPLKPTAEFAATRSGGGTT